MNRRDLLTVGGSALVGAAVAGRLFAAPTTGPRFLLVFLRGGYDSTQLPHSLFEQLLLRGAPRTSPSPGPTLASSTGARAWMPTGRSRPRCARPSGTLYSERQAAFIPFAGTDDLSRSHFETQDSIELGQPVRRRTQLPLRLSRQTVRRTLLGSSRRRCRSHSPMRCRSLSQGAATVPQSIAQECRQAAVRRAPSAHLERHVRRPPSGDRPSRTAWICDSSSRRKWPMK